MLVINDTTFSEDDFIQQHNTYRQAPLINQHKKIAVCVEDTFAWLTLCYYLKSIQTSVMPIHPNIPYETAKRMAEKAGCSLLLYKAIDQCTVLEVAEQTHARPGIIQMSSGTTGEPKCILRSWADIDIEIDSYCEFFTDTQSMTPVVACPTTHSYGLICGVMVALKRGLQPVIINSINPKYLIKKIKSVQKPLLYSSPVMLQGLLRLWPANEKLFAAMTSGSIMSEQVFEQIQPKIEHFFQQYGCSEAGCISIASKLEKANQVGKPLPHVDITCSRDSQNPAEIIAKVKTEVGIKTIGTQDLGFIDDSENIRFMARLDDTIIVSGLNVYPTEVEDIILKHPKVSDAVIFKMDDQFAGHRVCLQYVADSELDPIELRQWSSEHLAPFQLPQVLQQVDEIARMANSKVNRKQIALDFQQSQLTA
ncbi:AMP-binding protein [Catenovulum sp. SM1970]|uniref:AMP-binding protein n=1 Tax=Marinifaba aquimaris TaxID=2741323 RepID=UPI0015747590|nr:AMP-binding protein [Marinifaba aquimaris]NTS78836.1 AMP-binding protein [Marinifaba aquimaris]